MSICSKCEKAFTCNLQPESSECETNFWQKALEKSGDNQHDIVNHPSHYTSHPSGVECITITQHHNFCVGNAIKYMWRAGLKSYADNASVRQDTIRDLKKAEWYIKKEIERLENEKETK